MSDKKQTEQNKTAAIDSTASDSQSLQANQGLSASITLDDSVKKNRADATNSNNENDNSERTKKTTRSSHAKASSPIPPLSESKNSVKSSQPQVTEKALTPKLSKTAILALLLALIAITASVAHYFWLQQQSALANNALDMRFQQALQQSQASTTEQLTAQNQKLEQQFDSFSKRLAVASQNEIAQLQQQIAQLSQNQPSDWLLHEAEYLIRVAVRTLWLEKDTAAAIGLLNDAEQRLKALNDPQYLPVRQTIHQDIATLQLMPVLQTDDIILKLMALDKQVATLVLAMVDIPDSTESADSLELSENASDWQENLAKTWRKFLADFITVSRRTGSVEPLMSPQYQQNLRENISLKIQAAIWAASKANSDIYLGSLTDTQAWMKNYFDPDNTLNQNFSEQLEQLKSAQISYQYPRELASLQAIRQQLKSNITPTIIPEKSTIPEQVPLEITPKPNAVDENTASVEEA
jgi:uroporphyrin-3 C-methyltransferase